MIDRSDSEEIIDLNKTLGIWSIVMIADFLLFIIAISSHEFLLVLISIAFFIGSIKAIVNLQDELDKQLDIRK